MSKQTDERPEDREFQRKGLPIWFIILTIGLIAWGVYYLIRYWGGLGPGAGY